MVGDQDHGPLLDRHGDPLRARLCTLLSRLHVLPALSTVLDFGGRSLSAALTEAGPDGDVLVVDPDVDRLEQVRRQSTAPNVFFLIGDVEVLPLLDRSVDVVLGGSGGDVERVLRVP